MKTKSIDPEAVLIGAHMSVAGGLYTAFERGDRVGCTAMQIFTKNSNQWNDPQLSQEDIAKYREAQNKSKIRIVVSHDSYLINLCGATRQLLSMSRKAFINEIDRCRLLGIRYIIFHPGAHTTRDRKAALKIVSESLNFAHEATKNFGVVTLVETTAGQGTTVGSSFAEIAEVISGVKDQGRVGVCIDTCHIFAAGYDIRTRTQYDETMTEFEKTLGFDKLHAIHFNDAKKPLGSHVDRHEHIGKGEIGKEAFRFFMNDERLTIVPKILETPKGEEGYKMDIENLSLLKSMVRKLRNV